MYHIYLDAEFDGIALEKRYHQVVLSIGAVMSDDQGKIISKFYRTICPLGFQRITATVKKITHLQDEVIRSSKGFQEVMDEFSRWCHQVEQDRRNLIFYSYGPDDRRTILKNAQLLHLDYEAFFTPVLDLQRLFSKTITYNGSPIRRNISLDDALKSYGLVGDVLHNALNDACDLMRVHQAFLNHKEIDQAYVRQLVEKIKQKEEESRRKMRAQLTKNMRRRFGGYKETIALDLSYHLVREQMNLLKDRDASFPFEFHTHSLCYQKQRYSYKETRPKLVLHLRQDIPSVEIRICYQQERFVYQTELNHRNANLIDHIYKLKDTEQI